MTEITALLLAVVPIFCVLGAVTHAMTQPAKRAVEKRRVRDLHVRANVRKTFPPEAELRALARSVMKRLIHPLIILPDGTLLDGECRWRGLMLEEPDFEVDVIVLEREPTASERFEIQLVSALHSATLSAYDQALASKEYLENTPGATAKSLAEKIDRDPSMVGRLLALWKTTPEVIKAAEEGRLGVKAWYQISLLPEGDMVGMLAMYTSGMPVSQIEEISRQKRKPANPKDEVTASTVRYPLSTGTTVVVRGEEMSLSGMIEALQLALEGARKASKESLDVKTAQRVWADKAKAGA